MSTERAPLTPITFVYAYAGHGWAHASISTEADTYAMVPSYVLSDPLAELLHAVVEVLRFGGDARCLWFYEPATDQWEVHREGDTLWITIRGLRDGGACFAWPFEEGELQFTATCDLWQFAAKVRLAVSRLRPAADAYDDPTSVQRTAEYQALCDFLEEHKRSQPSPSGKRAR